MHRDRGRGTDSRRDIPRQGQARSNRETSKEDTGGQTPEGTPRDRDRQGPAERLPRRTQVDRLQKEHIVTGTSKVQRRDYQGGHRGIDSKEID